MALLRWWCVLSALVVATVAERASACGGAFVRRAEAPPTARLVSDASQAVLMRAGNRTVASVQINYGGPLDDFAIVFPVPVVLQKDDVKTLEASVFEELDRRTAPVLKEYVEADPCGEAYGEAAASFDNKEGGTGARAAAAPPRGGVRIEAKFTAGEYQVVILSADDSGALETWLGDNGYAIPEGSAPYLEPYVRAKMKFFVAKVDAKKVKLEDGRAVLSPLRFRFDAKKLVVPLRLGLANAPEQELIVHVLSPDGAFEAINYPTVMIPSRVRVTESVKDDFGAFYEALFQKTLDRHPRAAVIETVAWMSQHESSELAPLAEMLGADALPLAYSGLPFVVTRLHFRYSKSTLPEDVELAKIGSNPKGVGDRFGNVPRKGWGRYHAWRSQFHARYEIRHPWSGTIDCENPEGSRWELKEGSENAVTNVAFRKRGGAPPELESMVIGEVKALGVKGQEAPVGKVVVPVTLSIRRAPILLGVGFGLGLLGLLGLVRIGRRER